ncbi:hypothetical protein C8R45DRAFT_93465 [Mycena sanguinolenta]|nr:hypothetical protein C8R45DRAFT_93465 [Mycena sanguinolenta]
MSSPFASHLGTNYCPQDEEITQIKALLNQPCLRLKSIEQEMALIQKALDKLTAERDALEAYVDAHKALLSPVRRLPRDIIETIFLACLPTHRNCAMSAQEAPVLLGRICGSWRAISLSTPLLWSRLHIVEPARMPNSTHIVAAAYETKVAQRLEVARAWLRRSGSCPLSISLQTGLHHNMPLPASSTSTPSEDLFLNILIPLALRWQDISLTIPPSVQALSDLTEWDVPLLKSLKIAEYMTNAPHTHPQWDSILHAPALSKLSLAGCDIPSSSLPVRWSNLTDLSLLGSAWGTQTCQDILDILSRCSQLRTCKVAILEFADGYLQDSIVECPFLHSIELYSRASALHHSGCLLSRLSAPDLQSFTLRSEKLNDFNSLLSCLATFTSLKSVSIDSVMFSSSRVQLMDFLCGLPSTVQHLQISEPRILHQAILDDNIFRALEASPDRSTPLPALENLVITDCREVSDEALLRFIISRISTLRRVDVTFDREMQADILPRLHSFLESGAHIFIAYATTQTHDFSPWIGLPDGPTLGQ